MMDDHAIVAGAIKEAERGLSEGDLPIGSVPADPQRNTLDESIVARGGGHNLRVQTGDPAAHAEVACIRNAGRRRDWPRQTATCKSRRQTAAAPPA